MCISFSVKADEIESKDDLKVWIKGAYIFSDVEPIIESSRTQVPIRFISNELGYNVEWDSETKGISISNEDIKIHLQVGSGKAFINGEEKLLDNKVFIKNSRTYVPLRFIAEGFNESVSWDEETKTAIVGDGFDNKEYYLRKYYLNEQIICKTLVNYIDMKEKTDEKEENINSFEILPDDSAIKIGEELNRDITAILVKNWKDSLNGLKVCTTEETEYLGKVFFSMTQEQGRVTNKQKDKTYRKGREKYSYLLSVYYPSFTYDVSSENLYKKDILEFIEKEKSNEEVRKILEASEYENPSLYCVVEHIDNLLYFNYFIVVD